MPDPDFLPIPDPGSRGQKGTGSRIRYTDGVMCREKKQKAVMREKETLCQILLFTHIGSRDQKGTGSRIRNTVNTVCVQGEETEGGDA